MSTGEQHVCEVCGSLDDAWTCAATLIEHRTCGAVWGRVNGTWVREGPATVHLYDGKPVPSITREELRADPDRWARETAAVVDGRGALRFLTGSVGDDPQFAPLVDLQFALDRLYAQGWRLILDGDGRLTNLAVVHIDRPNARLPVFPRKGP